MSSERKLSFDIMKGIGILMMIACHYVGWNHTTVSHVINSFHMPMFFLVAGYFSKGHLTKAEDFNNIARYVRRLLPAFLLTQISISAWYALIAFLHKGSWDQAIVAFLSVFWADPYGPVTSWGRLSVGVIWFLMALLVAKIILIPLSKLGKWSIPLSLFLSYGSLLMNRFLSLSIWGIGLGLTALPFVVIGWWVRKNPVPAILKILSVVAWVMALLFSHLGMYDMDWGCFPLDVLGACGGSYVLYLISFLIYRHTRLCANLLALVGVWSLALMCAHCFEIASHLGNHVMGLFSIPYSLVTKYLVSFIVTVVLAVFAYYMPLTKKVFS